MSVFRQLCSFLRRESIVDMVFSESFQGPSHRESDTGKESLPIESEYLQRNMKALWRTGI